MGCLYCPGWVYRIHPPAPQHVPHILPWLYELEFLIFPGYQLTRRTHPDALHFPPKYSVCAHPVLLGFLIPHQQNLF